MQQLGGRDREANVLELLVVSIVTRLRSWLRNAPPAGSRPTAVPAGEVLEIK
jgi:hypothetical protein